MKFIIYRVILFVKNKFARKKKVTDWLFLIIVYKFITFTFLTKQSIIQKFKEVELQVLRFFDVFYLLRKVLHARFCKKKSIKKYYKKIEKSMKNLKCKMKKMTYPPIANKTLITTTVPLMVPGPKQKLEMKRTIFFVLQKTL